MSLLDAPVRMAPAKDMGGIRSLVALIMGDHVTDPPFTLPGSALRLCFDLGMMAHGRRGFGKPAVLAQNDPQTVLEVMDAGWNALADWPHGFHSFIDDLRSQASRRQGQSGMGKAFGALPKWLAKMAGTPEIAMLAEEFTTHVAAQDDVASRTREIRRRRSEDPLRGRVITGVKAAASLGVDYPRLRKVAEAQGLWLVRPGGKGASGLLRGQELQRVADEVEGHLTKQDAARLLNISKASFWCVEEMSLLPMIPEGDRILPWLLYRRQDVEALLARLETKVDGTARLKPEADTVSVDGLARGSFNIAQIVAAVLEGSLMPDGINIHAKGLRRLLFKRQWLPATLGIGVQNMSMGDAATALGVPMGIVYEWVRLGLLKSTPGQTRAEPGQRISQQAIDAFQQEYATGVELAASLGSRSRRFASEQLIALGLVPVSGPKVDNGHMFLFRRRDFASVDTTPLRDFTLGQKPNAANDGNAVLKLIGRVGDAVAKILGFPLIRRNNHFIDGSRAIVVQVVTGRRFGFTGAFRFTLYASQIDRLERAFNGYLALGFVGQPRFVLVPWRQAQHVLRRRSDLRADVFLKVDAAGRPAALEEFCHALHG